MKPIRFIGQQQTLHANGMVYVQAYAREEKSAEVVLRPMVDSHGMPVYATPGGGLATEAQLADD